LDLNTTNNNNNRPTAGTANANPAMSKTPILITAFKQKLHGDFWTGKARQYEHVLFCIGILASYWIIAI